MLWIRKFTRPVISGNKIILQNIYIYCRVSVYCSNIGKLSLAYIERLKRAAWRRHCRWGIICNLANAAYLFAVLCCRHLLWDVNEDVLSAVGRLDEAMALWSGKVLAHALKNWTWLSTDRTADKKMTDEDQWRWQKQIVRMRCFFFFYYSCITK